LGDAKRINHFMKVYAFASTIGQMEQLDERTQEILEVAAVVHDIAVVPCERKYGSTSGELQEKEGPALAEQLLARVGGFDNEFVERVLYLVGNHHSYAKIENDLDFQILVEADMIVNMDEESTELPEIRRVEKNIFRTEAGTAILQNMFYEQ
jgi:HD superfamily phosphodiesterase